MNPAILTLLPAFLRSLGVLARQVEDGAKGAAIGSAADFAATAIERGSEAYNELKELTDYISSLAAGEEPSLETWHDFKARNDAAQMIFNGGKDPTPVK